VLKAGRPAPSRRTRTGAEDAARRSFAPRMIVLRATPVARDTAAVPPYPAAAFSVATNNRRPLSSNWSLMAAYRARIAFSSIIRES
jgi:hypothetical protein